MCQWINLIDRNNRSNDANLLKLSKEQLIKVLLYSFSQLDQNQNRYILNSLMDYIVEPNRIKFFISN